MSQTRTGFACTTDIALFRQSEGGLQILLIKRGGKVEHGLWAMPGGHVDPEDTFDIEAAAKRELLEETGINCHQEPFPIELRYLCARKNDVDDWIGHTFWGIVGPHQSIMGARAADDVQDLGWFNLPAFLQLQRSGQMAFDHGDVVKELFGGVSRLLDPTLQPHNFDQAS